MNDEIELGPVDYLIVEWPAGKQPTGEGIKLLAEFTDLGLINVLDLVFVQKNEDGTVSGLALMDLDSDGDLDLVSSAGLRRACSARTTTTRRARRSSRAPRRRSCSTRTAGRVRSSRPSRPAGTARRERPHPRSRPRRRRRDPRDRKRLGGRKMPLLRGVARVAVISGTATAVSNRVSRRQADRWAQEEPAAGLRAGAPRRRRPGGRPARAAPAARRAEGARSPHRGRVRGAEGQDPRRRLDPGTAGAGPATSAPALYACTPGSYASTNDVVPPVRGREPARAAVLWPMR